MASASLCIQKYAKRGKENGLKMVEIQLSVGLVDGWEGGWVRRGGGGGCFEFGAAGTEGSALIRPQLSGGPPRQSRPTSCCLDIWALFGGEGRKGWEEWLTPEIQTSGQETQEPDSSLHFNPVER
jgi:hypothetical protein